MRQLTKSFVVEHKTSRKPKSDAKAPLIWGRLDADIAQVLKDQQDAGRDHATRDDDRV